MPVSLLVAVAGLLGLFLHWPARMALAMLAGGLGATALWCAWRLISMMVGREGR